MANVIVERVLPEGIAHADVQVETEVAENESFTIAGIGGHRSGYLLLVEPKHSFGCGRSGSGCD